MMMNLVKNSPSSGQALILLTVFVTIGLSVTLMAVTLAIATVSGSSRLEQAALIRQAAESGAENALLRLVRDPTYSGETLTVDDATVTITVSGSSTKVISVVSRRAALVKELQLVGSASDGRITVQFWPEVY